MREPTYIPGFHGLRALACTAVFAVHWHQRAGVEFRSGVIDLDRLLHNGNTGVALLFLLSGYLLSRPIWMTVTPAARARPFVRNRVARILPAYYICLTAIVMLKLVKGDWPDWHDTLLHYSFTHNFDADTFYALCPQFWTLAVQVQYYLLFGLLLWPMARLRSYSPVALFVALLAIVAASYTAHVCIMEAAQDSSPSWRLTRGTIDTVLGRSVLAHCPIFFLGAALGYFDTSPRRSSTNARNLPGYAWDLVAVLSLAVSLLVLGTNLDDRLQIPYGRYNFPFIPLLLSMMIVAVPRTIWTKSLFEKWPIRWLGTVSYGFYVYHYTCMSVVEFALQGSGRSFSLNPWLGATLSFLLALLVSSLSFVLIERPVMQMIKPTSASLG